MQRNHAPGLSLGQLFTAGLLIALAIAAVCYQSNPAEFERLEYSPAVQQWTGR